jgi:nitrogen fixation protein NifB
LIHAAHPALINCLSTNGLVLEDNVAALADAGVQTVTVTVNAIAPAILAQINAGVTLDGATYTGIAAAEILAAAQLRGISAAAAAGMVVKVNTVLIPGVNDEHIGDIARTVAAAGAHLYNIIPLIPNGTFAHHAAPTCDQLAAARAAAEQHIPVFHHCHHCRADACGIPGKTDISAALYANQGIPIAPDTFSHG